MNEPKGISSLRQSTDDDDDIKKRGQQISLVLQKLAFLVSHRYYYYTALSASYKFVFLLFSLFLHYF